jgi:hypothetical protein
MFYPKVYGKLYCYTNTAFFIHYVGRWYALSILHPYIKH